MLGIPLKQRLACTASPLAKGRRWRGLGLPRANNLKGSGGPTTPPRVAPTKMPCSCAAHCHSVLRFVTANGATGISPAAGAVPRMTSY